MVKHLEDVAIFNNHEPANNKSTEKSEILLVNDNIKDSRAKSEKSNKQIEEKTKENQSTHNVKEIPEKSLWLKYTTLLSEGSRDYKEDIPNHSIKKLREAIQISKTNFKDLKYQNKSIKSCKEVVALKFIYAR